MILFSAGVVPAGMDTIAEGARESEIGRNKGKPPVAPVVFTLGNARFWSEVAYLQGISNRFVLAIPALFCAQLNQMGLRHAPNCLPPVDKSRSFIWFRVCNKITCSLSPLLPSF